MSDYITPVPKWLASSLRFSANRLVRLDPEYARKLRELEGRFAVVHLSGTGLTMSMGVEDGHLQVSEQARDGADVVLRGSPAALFGLASGGTGRRGQGKVEVSGDATVGQRFAECFKALDLDWEEPLARTFGDVAGHRMASFLRSAVSFGQRASDSFSHSLSEYLTEESGWVIGRNELNDFYDQVDDLREDAERLEARVRKLLRKRS